MTKHLDTRLVFMGTPEFAVASLAALLEAKFQVVAVVTAPDKPAGRGLELKPSAVKAFAAANQIPVLQPTKLKDPAFVAELASYQADLQVVVAFRMLPEIVWNMPRLGTINVHGSLLPRYRGAAPINWALINGDSETGVTTFQLQHEIDTGGVLLQERIPITPQMNAGLLHDIMKETGGQVLVKTLEGYLNGTLTPTPQEQLPDFDVATLPHAPKIFTETCQIDWTQPAQAIHNRVRGLSPFPGAFTRMNGKQLKIYATQVESQTGTGVPGTCWVVGKDQWLVQTGAGSLRLLHIQLEGKKRMDAADFLRGYAVDGLLLG
jgi:methionyl-tRNA formyltransferase